MARRRGLVRSAARTMGRTALIAGTATAVSGRVATRQQQKFAQKHPPQAAPLPEPAGAGYVEEDMVSKLQHLTDLRAAGALTDKEFVAAKTRVLQR